MKFVEVTLAGPAELTQFYRDELGLPLDGGAIRIGETTLRFLPDEGTPFYHFALLVPGDRFEAAQAWAEQRVEILSDAEGTRVFESDDWNSSAVYFHDPAGNILEGSKRPLAAAISSRRSWWASRSSGSSAIGQRSCASS